MNTKKLGELSKPKQWKNLPTKLFTATGFPVYGANGVIGYYSDFNHEHPTIAIGCRGACGTIHITTERSYVTSNAMALDELNEDECKLEYLAQFLKYRGFRDVITGASQPQITRENLIKIEIPLPPLDDQIRIAHLLGKMEVLIAQRKRHLQQLDDLLQSVFLDMFGDTVRNDKEWDIGSLSTHGSFKNGLNFGKGESGVTVRYLGVGDFKSKATLDDFDKLGFIELNEMPTEDYFLQDGDLLFVRSNGNRELVGRCMAIYPGTEKVTYSGFCIRYRINDPALQPTYIAHLFRSTAFRRVLFQGGQGANIQNINQQILSSLLIPVPAEGLQSQFAVTVEKVEILKSRYQQSLTDLEALYGALSQHAFKGELDLSRVPIPGIEAYEEKIVSAEALEPTDEQDFVIHFTDTDNLVDALRSTEAREGLITQWLEAYRNQLGDNPLSVQHFMAAAQTQLAELHPENDFELGANDYEHIKAWVFEVLAAGMLTQDFDSANNRILIKSRAADWGSW